MEPLIFTVLSIPLIIISRKSLSDFKSHGFYRFFGWEGVLWLLVINYRYWFVNPFSAVQIVSWVLLFYALVLVIFGFVYMKKMGKPKAERQGEELYPFEKTTELIQTGVFKYVRHPLYGSLLFLTWGVCLKNPESSLDVIAFFATIFFYLTAKLEEDEDIKYFGDKYREYISKSKMFIPYIF